VLAGLGALVLIVVIAILRYGTANDVTSVATSTGAVIDTVVSAFFGVAVVRLGVSVPSKVMTTLNSRQPGTKAQVRGRRRSPPDKQTAKAAVAANL
jgi:formate-dependent nitrite reductase membrane component NrfD